MEKLLYEDLSYKIRGCVFKVYNTLGFGHKENVYQKALASEFEKIGINFEKEKALSVIYNNRQVGTYRPDFIVESKIIIEIKAVPVMPKSFETQLTYYLKSTNFKLGFIINFGSKKLDIRRRIWTPHYHKP
ncbi:MAG TPA: GxxExxY protein [bacterium]|nr:GxxExxY protein [bacterium]